MIETADADLDVVEQDEALVLRRASERRLYKMGRDAAAGDSFG